MGSARAHTTRFLLGFVAVLALPALVWGIQAIQQDRSEPASTPEPVVEAPRHDELGCKVLTAPESLSERAAACETEPPAPSKPKRERKARPEPRSAEIVNAATAAPTSCAGDCSTGAIEAVEQVEATEEPQNSADLVGTLLAPVRERPLDRVDDEVEETLDNVEEVLGRINIPDDVPVADDVTDTATTVIEDAEALLPEGTAAPEIEIQLDPLPTEAAPGPAGEQPGAEEPVAEETSDEAPAGPDTSELTALLVLDERTAEELGIPRRMTVALSDRVQRALAVLSERAGLELRVAAAGSSGPARD